jgi:penicillin amidase
VADVNRKPGRSPFAFLRDLLHAARPQPVSWRERLAAFPRVGLPLQRPVVIRWNQNQVPFIEAETDRDAAVCIGLVHGHLRGAQIALFKRFFYGRLSELVGPFGRNIDHVIRILDYGHCADALAGCMPPETRSWIEGYVDGLNAQQASLTQLPPEFAVLGMRPEPFTFRDILVGGRFGGTDFNWLTYFPVLAARGQPGFAELWNRTLEVGDLPTATARPHEPHGELEDLLLGTGRTGSNSVAVSARRSATGAALMASDPHLGLSLPNLWVLMGLRSPSFNVVGFTIVGLPVFGLGRNPDLAWGGTNLRAASSDLYDVSRLPPGQITTTKTKLRARFWRPVKRRLRKTPFGPIVSDAKVVRMKDRTPVALRWVGHEPTDEFTGLLRAARARTPEEFRQAFVGYGVSGQNMLFADTAGNIGRVMAVTQPIRRAFPLNDPVLDASDPATHWQGFAGVFDLPSTLNPDAGVIASANDRPTGTDLPIGFAFGTDDRIRRLYALLNVKPRLTIEDLQALQVDTYAPDAARLAAALLRLLGACPGDLAQTPVVRRLAAWDGDYAIDSSGAVAFEMLLTHVVTSLYGSEKKAALPELYSQWSYLTTFLIHDLEACSDGDRQRLLADAVAAAARDAAKFASWGEMHRLQVGPTLSRVPFVGRFFIARDLPVGGSRQTPMKMSHGLERGRHASSFGSMARHISDLSDLDNNWFCILGGQDGWIGSENFLDQLELWQERRYIRMPLRPATIEAEFPVTMTLMPKI